MKEKQNCLNQTQADKERERERERVEREKVALLIDSDISCVFVHHGCAISPAAAAVCCLRLWMKMDAARKLYKKLGYKTVKEEDDDSYKLVAGRIEQVEVKNVYMKKSLKPFVGPLLNADYFQVALWAAGATLALNDEARDQVLGAASQQLGVDLAALLNDLLSALPLPL